MHQRSLCVCERPDNVKCVGVKFELIPSMFSTEFLHISALQEIPLYFYVCIYLVYNNRCIAQ